MKFSKIMIATLSAGVIGLFTLGSAQAFQPMKAPATEAASHIVKVDHHGKCYKWKYSHGEKYCYKWRYKSCYKWRHDDYGNKTCYKWKWKYYSKSHHGGYGGRKSGGYSNY